MFIDSHAHLFFKDYQNDLDDVLQRARDAGVEYIVCPGTDLETSRRSIELSEKYDLVYACVGFHPHDALKASEKSLEEIEKLSHHPKVVAVGEIGLDYHYNFSPPGIQREVFSKQIDIARRRNLPVVIHSREAEGDTLEIVEETVVADVDWRKSGLDESHGGFFPRGVFHCFAGNSATARKVINWGFFISIPGLITFPVKPGKNGTMIEVVQSIPIEHILLETDSPYLTPHPYRGKRNEPSYIPIIAGKISELTGLSLETVGRESTLGAQALFGIGKKLH